mmetsp:Transcript_16802/g.29501  ORF Transcript_16802/g.29501 Transcript_16802/m.29501 type:complete len:283 (+) Transcript_16802:49-897(+)
MGQGLSDVTAQCCQQEPISKRTEQELDPTSFSFRVGSESKDEQFARVQLRHWTESSDGLPISPKTDPTQSECGSGYQCGTCSGCLRHSTRVSIESLNYLPVRFDDSSTIDTERSEDRYENLTVHTSRLHTRRQMQNREAWLRAAVSGKSAMLLQAWSIQDSSDSMPSVQKVPATYILDQNHAALSILPQGRTDIDKIVILMDAITAICPIRESVLFMAQWESHLSELEQSCAVLMKYSNDDDISGGLRQVCVLEESEAAKDSFIQVLTSLWLNKPRRHSMWY